MSKKVVIASPSYNDKIGGVISLHYLAGILKRSGFDVAMYPFDYNDEISKYKTLLPDIEVKTIFDDVDEIVAIYPDVVHKNPIGASTVIRWLLHRPKFFNDAEFTEGEYIFIHNEAHFAKNDPLLDKPRLKIYMQQHNIYFNKGIERPINNCVYIGKGFSYHQELSWAVKALCIDSLGHYERAHVLNSCNYMLCADLHTFTVNHALQCGCVPVIIPPPNMWEEEFRDAREINHGVAWGFDQINEAKKMIPEGLLQIEAREKEGLETLKSFMGFLNDCVNSLH